MKLQCYNELTQPATLLQTRFVGSDGDLAITTSPLKGKKIIDDKILAPHFYYFKC